MLRTGILRLAEFAGGCAQLLRASENPLDLTKTQLRLCLEGGCGLNPQVGISADFGGTSFAFATLNFLEKGWDAAGMHKKDCMFERGTRCCHFLQRLCVSCHLELIDNPSVGCKHFAAEKLQHLV